MKFKEITKSISWIAEDSDIQTTYIQPVEYPSLYESIFGSIPSFTIYLNTLRLYDKDYPRFIKLMESMGFIGQDNTTKRFKFVHYKKYILISGAITENISETEVETDNDDDSSFATTEYLSMRFFPYKDWQKDIEKIYNTLMDDYFEKEKLASNNFYMIAQSSQGLYSQKTKFKSIPIKDNRYDLFYGEKFPHDTLQKFISDKTENLMLLHGDPGTGKSNYIKNIISGSKKKVIYIPPSMLSVIASPDFISYMLSNRGSILLIEDAEEVLSTDRNTATNNLLGLTDGFLKDSLDLKIICTFNCDIGKIDKALQRKGRLYFEYKFDKLNQSEGQKLSDYMKLGLNISEDLTLAEIFNQADNSLDDSFNKERTIGFFG